MVSKRVITSEAAHKRPPRWRWIGIGLGALVVVAGLFEAVRSAEYVTELNTGTAEKRRRLLVLGMAFSSEQVQPPLYHCSESSTQGWTLSSARGVVVRRTRTGHSGGLGVPLLTLYEWGEGVRLGEEDRCILKVRIEELFGRDGYVHLIEKESGRELGAQTELGYERLWRIE